MSDVGGLQLLPETRKRIEVRMPGENQMIIVGVIVVAIAALLIAGLYFYKNSLENKLTSLDAEISTLEQQRNRQAEQNILIFNKQVSMLLNLLNEHPYWTTGFSKLESLAHGQVQFASLNVSLPENKISFKATASSYTIIASQIAAFLSDESIKDITLNKVTTLTNGRLEFTMQIIFDRSKFLKNR